MAGGARRVNVFVRKNDVSVPIPQADLKALFDFLVRADAPACDHTLNETTAFPKSRRLPVEQVIPWLQDHGGFCDGEVIYNVEDKFGEIVGR